MKRKDTWRLVNLSTGPATTLGRIGVIKVRTLSPCYGYEMKSKRRTQVESRVTSGEWCYFAGLARVASQAEQSTAGNAWRLGVLRLQLLDFLGDGLRIRRLAIVLPAQAEHERIELRAREIDGVTSVAGLGELALIRPLGRQVKRRCLRAPAASGGLANRHVGCGRAAPGTRTTRANAASVPARIASGCTASQIASMRIIEAARAVRPRTRPTLQPAVRSPWAVAPWLTSIRMGGRWARTRAHRRSNSTNSGASADGLLAPSRVWHRHV